MYDMLMDTSGKKNFYVWDLMTAVIMLKPELCGFQPLHLEVVTAEGSKSGQMLVSEGGPNVEVCLHPDADGIRQTLIEVLAAKP
jgi:inosine-uridine nucleoside N-ribohydrolase